MAEGLTAPRRSLWKAKRRLAFAVSIAKDIEHQITGYRATSEMPWLRIEFGGRIPAGRWIRLTFFASLLDPLCRPLLRFITADGHHDVILPGALFGSGTWLGRLPKETREVWISPTNRPGQFGFSIERIEVVPRARLVGQCFLRNPRRCCVALAARLGGLRFLADLQIRRVLSVTPLRDYDAWRRQRIRAFDVTDLDAPRFDWKTGPCIVYAIAADSNSASILRSLVAQPYPNWRVLVMGEKLQGAMETATAEQKGRIITAQTGQDIGCFFETLSSDVLLAFLPAGGESPDYALMTLAEAARRDPDADIFYGDEDHIDVTGRRVGITLKSDWSPRFQSSRHYLGSAVFFRVRALRHLSVLTALGDLGRSRDDRARDLIARGCLVRHVRRVLLTVPLGREIAAEPAFQPCAHELPPATARTQWRASIILPTRDRRALLENCIQSLRANILRDDMEVIVVDNGSADKDAIHFLSTLSTDRRFRVLSRPGAFNFSALCNDAAAAASGPVLVFLNNDTEATEETRIEPLLSFAMEPDVGAVGAKLLYPSRRVQHAGIILGTDGYACHFERGLRIQDSGYFGRLCVAHDISAVTAACLAVEKWKFAAVGGFDSIHLPVELNDVDLCLRLAERGWNAVCACECVLLHRESSSRGATLRPDAVYRAELDYIHARWINRLRDDPYFHPGLSLDSLSADLG